MNSLFRKNYNIQLLAKLPLLINKKLLEHDTLS